MFGVQSSLERGEGRREREGGGGRGEGKGGEEQ